VSSAQNNLTRKDQKKKAGEEKRESSLVGGEKNIENPARWIRNLGWKGPGSRSSGGGKMTVARPRKKGCRRKGSPENVRTTKNRKGGEKRAGEDFQNNAFLGESKRKYHAKVRTRTENDQGLDAAGKARSKGGRFRKNGEKLWGDFWKSNASSIGRRKKNRGEKKVWKVGKKGSGAVSCPGRRFIGKKVLRGEGKEGGDVHRWRARTKKKKKRGADRKGAGRVVNPPHCTVVFSR